LLNKTIEGISDEGAMVNCVAAQVVDPEQKIKLAISESVRVLHQANCVCMTVGAVVPFTSTAGAPTISRLPCDNIFRCFGFTKIALSDVDAIVNKILWPNVHRFLAQSISQTVTIWGAFVTVTLFSFGPGGIPLALAAPLLEVLPVARLIVKCACDLTLVLDAAFKLGGKTSSMEQIKKAALQYRTKQKMGNLDESPSIRQLVHRRVPQLIPYLPIKFYKGLQIAAIRTGMEAIIQDNRFDILEGWDSSLSMDTFSLSSEEDEDLIKFEQDYVNSHAGAQ